MTALNIALEVLEGLGLVVAIMDFTGWSRWLEEFIDRKRDQITNWYKDRGFWETNRNIYRVLCALASPP